MCPQNDNDMTHVQKFALKAILLSFETNEVLRRVFKLQGVILWASQLCGPEIEQHRRLSASSMSSKQICVWINLKLDVGNLIVSIFGYWRDCQITLLRRPNDLLVNRNRTKSDSKRLYSFIQLTWLLLLFCTTFFGVLQGILEAIRCLPSPLAHSSTRGGRANREILLVASSELGNTFFGTEDQKLIEEQASLVYLKRWLDYMASSCKTFSKWHSHWKIILPL